jgi:hypothetical protein
MARERVHRNNAAKQAAYRARTADREPVRQARMALLGQELHGRLRQAVEAGTSHVPAVVLGKRADDTLINLMGYVTRGALPGARQESRLEGKQRGDGVAGDDPAVDR